MRERERVNVSINCLEIIFTLIPQSVIQELDKRQKKMKSKDNLQTVCNARTVHTYLVNPDTQGATILSLSYIIVVEQTLLTGFP